MRKFLPSKKFTIIFLIVIFLCAVGLFIALRSSKNVTSAYNPIVFSEDDGPTSLVELDSDGDGVLDWQEALWGTNPYLQDTDEDGVLDNVEIEAMKIKRVEETGVSKTEELNETAILSQQILSTVIAYQEKGLSSVGVMEELAFDIGENVKESSNLPDIYFIEDIKIDDTRSERDYYLDILTAMMPYKNVLDTELPIITNTKESDFDKAIQELEELKNIYLTLSEESLDISVPSSLVVYHLTLVNTYVKLAIADDNLKEVFHNPIVGAIGINQYKIYSDIFTQLIEEIN
jgi:hypothetical protein